MRNLIAIPDPKKQKSLLIYEKIQLYRRLGTFSRQSISGSMSIHESIETHRRLGTFAKDKAAAGSSILQHDWERKDDE